MDSSVVTDGKKLDADKFYEQRILCGVYSM